MVGKLNDDEGGSGGGDVGIRRMTSLLFGIQPLATGFYEPEKAMDRMALVPNVTTLTR